MDQTLLDKTNKLKLYLCCMNMTATDLAKLIDYTPAMISGYINGTRKLGRKAARMIQFATNGVVTVEELLRFNQYVVKKEVEQKVPETV